MGNRLTMDPKLIRDLERIDGRLRSLYYNGYFTRAVAEELQNTLKIVGVFRALYKNNTVRVHTYLLPKNDVINLLNKEYATSHTSKQGLLQLKKTYFEEYVKKINLNDLQNRLKIIIIPFNQSLPHIFYSEE